MECDQMCLRREFVELASVEGANISALCRRFGVSRKTGYKWLKRYRSQGRSGLSDRSRRPTQMRCATPTLIEQQVLAVRDAHRAWGGRKMLNDEHAQVPAASTITGALIRPSRPSVVRSSGSSALGRMNFGRWISKVSSRWSTGVGAIR
jgi:transposase-like protein